MYSISVAGATIDELLNSGTVINVNRGGTGYSDYVWVDHDISTVVSDQDIYGIRNALNTSLNAALATGGDTITSNDSVSNLVSVSTLSSNAGHIIINNVAASAYKITITEPTPATWTELGFSSSNIISRGGIANGTQEKAYDRYITTVSTVGLDIEQVMDAVNTALSPSPILISAAWGPTGAPVFDTTDVDHYANLRFQNTTTGLARVRYTMNQSGSTATNVVDDNRQLFSDTAHYIWSNQNTASLITATQDSDTWQAHDSLTLEVSYEGNSSINGNLVSGSVTVGNLWEGDDTSNAAKLNTALPGIITYDNFHIIDNNTSAAASTRFSDLKVGDSWIIYTKAGSTGTYTADNVTLSLYDGKTAASDVQGNGITTNIVYSFQDGALDGKGIVFGEMVRTGRGINNPAISNAFEQLYHNIVFGSVNSDQSFQYGERKNAGTYWDNTAGTSAGVYGWYSQAYYGGDTSYFFANGTNPTSVINHAIVYKQNDINASLLFMYDGSAFTVRGKGFDRDGNIVLDDDEQTLSAAEMASLASGGVVTIHGINFTNLQIDTSTLKRGDKFVIDVAAAAKLDGINGGPSNASNFQSTANIAVQGGPFMRDESDWGSSAQYRLANDAEDGLDVKLLGYFVDPINGNNDVSGVGYYDGQFELKSAQNGFVTGSVVGAPDDAAPSSASYHIRAEVNYQGSAIPLAGALVTSVYFSKMEGGEYRAVKDFVGAVGYANEIYGTRPDGTYGPLSGQYNTLNGSLVFDVLEVTASVIKFRIQGHIIDLNGNEWYAEEEEFLLNAGNNTSRDSTVIPPLIPSEVTDPLIIFRDAAFGGLFFDEFTLKDYERWSVGDRFTLALTASGQESPDIDEITFFSDNRGTNMPLSFRFYDGVLDNSNVDLHIYQIANNIAREDSSNMATDQVTDATLSISFGAYHPAVGGVQPEIIKRSASFNTVYQKGMDAGVAHYYSRAEDVAQFWNANGGFTLGSGGEGMTVRLGDGEMKFTIGSGLELGQMARIMSERIWLSLLGQNNGIAGGVGSKLPSNYKPYLMDEEDKYKIVQFVNFTPGSNTNEAVPGTFLAHSVLTGKDNDIKFYGSEDLMKAFNFTHIQEARDTMFNLSISDAHSGRTVTSGLKISAGGRILDVITDGLSLDIDSSIGLTHSTWDSKRGMFQADVKDSFSQFLHLADNATTLQIGANEGENLFLTLSDVTARSLGVDAIDVRNRESAARGLTKIDSAIRKTSSQRAIIGAQVNRLDHTINNLETASLNLTDSMSRIVDADIAREMMEFTKLNIIAQASASILTQANQMTSSILTLMR
jgi:flagellin-like hook-associated protein FlgL